MPDMELDTALAMIAEDAAERYRAQLAGRFASEHERLSTILKLLKCEEIMKEHQKAIDTWSGTKRQVRK